MAGLLGRLEALGFRDLQDGKRNEVAAEVVKSSEIAGELLDFGEVRSSTAWRLDMNGEDYQVAATW